jgi:hypothetical protein
MPKLDMQIDTLAQAAQAFDGSRIKTVLKEIVPEYTPQ